MGAAAGGPPQLAKLQLVTTGLEPWVTVWRMFAAGAFVPANNIIPMMVAPRNSVLFGIFIFIRVWKFQGQDWEWFWELISVFGTE